MKSKQTLYLIFLSFGLVLIFFVYIKFFRDENYILEKQERLVGVYDRAHFKAFLEDPNLESVRFYNGLSDLNSSDINFFEPIVFSVWATRNGCDFQDPQGNGYFQSGLLLEETSRAIEFGRERALSFRRNLSGGSYPFPKFHIKLSKIEIRELLEGNNAIGLYFGITDRGRPTFDVYNGNIVERTFRPYLKLFSTEPCPEACPGGSNPPPNCTLD
jgi:hypothetical protein